MAGTSRVNREIYARFCGRLVVKFHRPTRQPYEARASRTVLRETRGATPQAYSPDPRQMGLSISGGGSGRPDGRLHVPGAMRSSKDQYIVSELARVHFSPFIRATMERL
jgi:hypothetical protein